MRGEHQQQNNAVADIYEGIISNEEHALAKLQSLNLKNHFPRFIESYYNRKAKRSFEDNISQSIAPPEKHEKEVKESEPQFKEVASEMNIKNKQQTLLGILQKGRTNSTGLRKTHERAASSLGQTSNEPSIAEETKRIFKKQSNVEVTINKKNSQPQSTTARQIESSLPNILPKLQKGRESVDLGKSQNSIESVNKTALLDGKQRKGKQKIDFKDIIQANKRHKAQLEQKNEEQKKLQMQILHHHHSTKSFLEKVISKYALNSNNQQKYLKRALKKHDQSLEKSKLSPEKQTTQKSSAFQKAMQSQQVKMSQINNQIAELKHHFIGNSRKLTRTITLCDTSPFSQYLAKRSDTIDEESQEQDDTVEPLDSDPKQRYSYLMAHTREKKWGLMQRTDYDRTHTLSESRRTTGLTEQESTQQDSNRVVINQRLKNLLFG